MSDDNITYLHDRMVTDKPIPPENVLRGALKYDFKIAIIVGQLENGEMYFASSNPNGAEVLWYLELCKCKLLDIVYDASEED